MKWRRTEITVQTHTIMMMPQPVSADLGLCKQCGRIIESKPEGDSLLVQMLVTEAITPVQECFIGADTNSADQPSVKLEPERWFGSAARIKEAIWDRARRLRGVAS